ncbi:universal stress protein [Sporichthya polymorpha]|uniref:universal stress protein n=1 Tax=Sporichthya polymorpha TaxID=35751 RepID=UPI000360B0AA|nr:universal stress protein [Sporichthya polymorpha]
MERLVVGVDGSAGGRRALDWAVRHALGAGSKLDVVLAYQPEPLSFAAGGTDGRDLAEETATAQLRHDLQDVLMHHQETQPTITSRVVPGKPADVLLDAARDADLLVVGSHGKGGLATTLLGSVSEACVRRGTTPVVIVPAR